MPGTQVLSLVRVFVSCVPFWSCLVGAGLVTGSGSCLQSLVFVQLSNSPVRKLSALITLEKKMASCDVC